MHTQLASKGRQFDSWKEEYINPEDCMHHNIGNDHKLETQNACSRNFLSLYLVVFTHSSKAHKFHSLPLFSLNNLKIMMHIFTVLW